VRALAAAAAIAGGLLLLIVPRFVFPACEYLGRGRMHCTEAARGEYLVGGLLALVGVALLLVRPGAATAAAAGVAAALCAAAIFVPSYTRYCANPDMACHYGMVPTVRFVAGFVGIVELAAVVGAVRAARRDA